MTKPQKKPDKGSLFIWILLILVLLVAWMVIDASDGPGRPVNGLVTGFQSGKGGGGLLVIELPDGSIVRKATDQPRSIGTVVSCTRYARRVSGVATYHC
jgi:hypothetical protein